MANPFRTSNPVLNEKAFRDVVATGEAMTLQGTVNRTGFLLLCAVATAAWTWGMSHSDAPEAAMPWMFGGLIGGFIVALITTFKKTWSPITAPIYALLEGLALGGISAYFERRYPGIHTGRRSYVWDTFCNVVGLQDGCDSRDAGFENGSNRRHRWNRAAVFSRMGAWGFLPYSSAGDQRQRNHRNRFQYFRGDYRRAESGLGL
jgi:Bax inhibitor 1 like